MSRSQVTSVRGHGHMAGEVKEGTRCLLGGKDHALEAQGAVGRSLVVILRAEGTVKSFE